MTFLDFFMGGPERHVKFADQLNTATANLDALDLLPEAERRRRANHPDNWARRSCPTSNGSAPTARSCASAGSPG